MRYLYVRQRYFIIFVRDTIMFYDICIVRKCSIFCSTIFLFAGGLYYFMMFEKNILCSYERQNAITQLNITTNYNVGALQTFYWIH